MSALKGWKVVGLLVAACLLILSTSFFVFTLQDCPPEGGALTQGGRAFVRLKNRTALPQETDFERRATLEALLQTGDDRSRWLQSRAAVLDGYVTEVSRGGIEAANCYSLTKHDTHINLALRPDAPPRSQVVVEITPRMVERARSRGLDWSEETLKRELTGRWCRFEGWLLFDIEHADEAENTAPGRAGNWRATAWELHPVTRFETIPDAERGWESESFKFQTRRHELEFERLQLPSLKASFSFKQ